MSLPATRTDALSVMLVNAAGVVIGSLPGDDGDWRLLLTMLGNVWAIVSSALTFQDMLKAKHIYHLGFFVCGLLALTTITSVLLIISLVFPKADTVYKVTFYGSMMTVAAVFVFGLAQLVLTYLNDCHRLLFDDWAFCKHSTNYVIGLIFGVGLSGPILAYGLMWWTKKASHRRGCCGDRYTEEQYQEEMNRKAHLYSGVLVNRISSLCKVLLLGIYWYFVDADLTWDPSNGIDQSLWATGQWSKQGCAIINGLFNCN